MFLLGKNRSTDDVASLSDLKLIHVESYFYTLGQCNKTDVYLLIQITKKTNEIKHGFQNQSNFKVYCLENVLVFTSDHHLFKIITVSVCLYNYDKVDLCSELQNDRIRTPRPLRRETSTKYTRPGWIILTKLVTYFILIFIESAP